MFLNNYVPYAYYDMKKDEFLRLEQDDMYVVAYEGKLPAFFHYAL